MQSIEQGFGRKYYKLSKTYKVQLNTEEVKITEGLNRIARVYRKFYNLGLGYQTQVVRGLYDKNNEYLKNPEIRIPSETQVINYALKVYQITPSAKGVSTDIIKSAAQESYKKFMASYTKTGQAPKFMPRNSNTYSFKTVSVEVSEDSVKLSGMEEIKVYRKNYLPQGKYTNVSFTFDGRNWWILLKSTSPNYASSKNSESVLLGFNAQGRILLNGRELNENVFLSERYRNVSNRYKHSKSDYKRKANANWKLLASGKATSLFSKNMYKVNSELLSHKHRLEQMKNNSFARVASAIRKLSPSVLYIPSDKTLKELRDFPSFQLKSVEVQETLEEVVRRLKSLGVSVLRSH